MDWAIDLLAWVTAIGFGREDVRLTAGTVCAGAAFKVRPVLISGCEFCGRADIFEVIAAFELDFVFDAAFVAGSPVVVRAALESAALFGEVGSLAWSTFAGSSTIVGNGVVNAEVVVLTVFPALVAGLGRAWDCVVARALAVSACVARAVARVALTLHTGLVLTVERVALVVSLRACEDMNCAAI